MAFALTYSSYKVWLCGSQAQRQWWNEGAMSRARTGHWSKDLLGMIRLDGEDVKIKCILHCTNWGEHTYTYM